MNNMRIVVLLALVASVYAVDKSRQAQLSRIGAFMQSEAYGFFEMAAKSYEAMFPTMRGRVFVASANEALAQELIKYITPGLFQMRKFNSAYVEKIEKPCAEIIRLNEELRSTSTNGQDRDQQDEESTGQATWNKVINMCVHHSKAKVQRGIIQIRGYAI